MGCMGGRERERGTYGGVYDMLVSRVVVNVYCDAAEGRDFVCEFVEAGVVLSFRLLVVVLLCFQCEVGLNE
jgi:hypothetical protein